MPIAEGLALARQIVDALHAAHAKDVIHRDLKPANIALTPDGTVKVLDFGLAKSAVESPDGPHATPSASSTNSVAHAIVGTAAYMSPEQARGLAVDKRTDVWSFGCVLWAMLTGRPPFVSETVSGTMKAILEHDPDWSSLPVTIPRAIVHLLHRCLAKNPASRIHEIADAREALNTALAGAAPAARASTRRISRWQAVGFATALAGLVISLGVLIASRRQVRPATSRAGIAFTQLTNFTDSAIAPALSPDGSILAFIRGSRPFLSTDPIYVKQLPDGEAELLASDPRPKYGLAFSPDGSQLAYTVQGKGMHTYVMPVRGGEPQLLLANAAGLTWLDRHRLLFSAVKTGFHMGIVSAGGTGENRRDLYFPRHERSMAHYAFPSPDHRWALVVEMDPRPVWEPCRLIALDGSAPVRFVGPTGRCGSAGWSP